MVTTTRKEDYLGRDLVNQTPGTSNATDHVGRAVIAGDKDFVGRGLTSIPWAATTVYTAGVVVYIATGELVCTVSGTSGSTAPALPGAVGGTVVDGTVTWKRTE